MKVALALIAPAVAAHAAAVTLTVPQLIVQHRQLTGQVIDLDGWMDRCSRFDCSIAATRDGLRSYREARVLIGEAPPKLDAALDAVRGRHILLRVRVNNECWPRDGGCNDRAPQVTAVGMIAVLPSAKKPE